MNVKKLIPLIVAIVLGGIAAKVAFDFVQKRQSTIMQQINRPQMVIAKRNIDAGAVLGEDDLTLGDVASDSIPDNMFKSTDQLIGRVAVVGIVQGQAISNTLLAPRGMGAGLQAAIPIGMRAVTIDINEVTGVAGYLVAGCHVDVIQTFRDEKTGLPVSRTIAQNVKVTAIGQRHNPGEGDGGGHSITLLVTPAQAELLELASSTGRPRFSLRGGNDLNTVDTKGVTLAELMGKHAHDNEFNSVPTGFDTQPIITTQPSPMANSTTRPSYMDDSQWTIDVIRGSSETQVKFPLHNGGSGSDSDLTDTGHQ
jgi:pilus assembly protein CpaB